MSIDKHDGWNFIVVDFFEKECHSVSKNSVKIPTTTAHREIHHSKPNSIQHPLLWSRPTILTLVTNPLFNSPFPNATEILQVESYNILLNILSIPYWIFYMLGSQRSHCHNKTNTGFVYNSEGVGRKGWISSTTDRYRAGILDGHIDRQIKRLQFPRHSHSEWWI